LNYKTKKSKGPLIGLFAGIIIFSSSFWGINYALNDSYNMLKYMLLIPAYLFFALFVLVITGALFLSYQIDANGLRIKWGVLSIRIPWQDIEEVNIVEGKSNFFSILGVSWPGYMVGIYTAKGLGPIKMYATHPERGFIYLKTKRGYYGLTPDNFDLQDEIVKNTGLTVNRIDMNNIPPEIKGNIITEDRFYQLLLKCY